MRQRPLLTAVVVLATASLACLYGLITLAPARAADADGLPGAATVTGVVRAPKAFKAAQVHLMNVDKNVLFMVYTSGGRYRAANLFPGKYEVTVRAQCLSGDPQTIELAAGGRQTLEITLREAPAPAAPQGEVGFTTQPVGAILLVSSAA